MSDNGLLKVRMDLNGETVEDSVSPDLILLDYLRDTRGLLSVKSGCRIGYCGACTVVLDGDQPVHSCCMLAGQADGRSIETVEGASEEVLAFQAALARQNAPQCGFCMPGIVMTGVSLVRAADSPEAAELLLGNICRCGGYSRIFDAFREVTEGLRR